MAKSKNNLDVSVLIATYNRAAILRKTLESMIRLDRDGLSVEFVVVDNNSSDHTKKVIESFDDKLTIHYLFEPRPGKNCALNKALNEVTLGKLVVFTDDDVEPKKDWLKAIIAITNRWPDHSVFGGKIYLILPNNKVPEWVGDTSIPMCNLGAFDYGENECLFKRNTYPLGANFWVRTDIFADGRRFNVNIGPRPRNRTMGSETSFLKQLVEDEYEMVYSPDAVVGHCIQPEQMKIGHVVKRAYRLGRSTARIYPLRRRALLEKHPFLWKLTRGATLSRLVVKLLLAVMKRSGKTRLEKAVKNIIWIGYNMEALHIAQELKTRKISGYQKTNKKQP